MNLIIPAVINGDDDEFLSVTPEKDINDMTYIIQSLIHHLRMDLWDVNISLLLSGCYWVKCPL